MLYKPRSFEEAKVYIGALLKLRFEEDGSFVKGSVTEIPVLNGKTPTHQLFMKITG